MNVPAKKTAIEELRLGITSMVPEFKKALPMHIQPEKFSRVLITNIQTNPALLSADRTSFYAACVKAASDGLIPDGREAALVIYGDKVQYLPMVAGILKKVRNSGELLSISPHIVYEDDFFDYWVDETGEHLTHRPKFSPDKKNPVLAYAIAKTKDGGIYIEVMSVAEIEQVRQSSRAKGAGPWVNFWGEMARKTVIKRLAKRLPLSTDLEETIRTDDEFFAPSTEKDDEKKPTQERRKRIEKAVLDEPTNVEAPAIEVEIPKE